jgi:glycosyltransferase involved in cell wall biosynthesis
VPDPLISVVIPLYDGERFIRQAIESALAQTWERTEVIVVDDGSTDRGAEIASEYSVKLLRQENRGVGAARNRGYAEATGELVSFLDQDDRFLPEKLERQLEALLAEPDAGMCSCKMRIFLEPGDERPRWIQPHLLGTDTHSLQVGTLLTWRRTFEQIGAFDESLRWGNDADWFLRAREAQIPIAMVPEPLVIYRIHEGNESGRGHPVLQEAFKVFRASIKRRQAEAPGD